MKNVAPILFSNTNNSFFVFYKKTIIRLIVVLVSLNGFSQDLYVANDSYLYAKDIAVFVNNDIKLETATSNLFFRGDAQLIQNTDIKNSDAGELSIYQNQTTGIYEYNFWCSPVGVAIDGTLKANEDFDGSNIHQPLDYTDLENVNSSEYLYTDAYNGTATELSNYWMYTLKDGEGYYSWSQIKNTDKAGTGYGFTLKGSPNTDNVLDFRGRPNNGIITISCAFDGVDNQPTSGTFNTSETLTGNPYPSAIDLKLFFANSATNQVNLSGEIFFWEQKAKNSHYLADYEGGYGVYIPGDLSNLSQNGTYTVAAFENYNGDGSTNGTTTGSTTDFSLNNARRYAAVGQGFIVQTDGAGGTVTFDNSMRLYRAEDSSDGSVFAKSGNSKSQTTPKEIVAMSHNGVDYQSIIENPAIIPDIRIHTHINNAFYKENVIAFRENTPDNNTYNKFYDGASINELSADAYLISSGKTLAIKSINYDETTRIPFGFKASSNNTHYSVAINKLNNIPEDVTVFIFDNENQTYTDLENGTFDITLNKGVYNNRFEITFTQNNSLNVSESINESINVFQNNKLSLLSIHNPKLLELKSFSLFNISGKLIQNKTLNTIKNQHDISTKSLNTGVFVLKIELNNGTVVSKKVIIE